MYIKIYGSSITARYRVYISEICLFNARYLLETSNKDYQKPRSSYRSRELLFMYNKNV